MERRKFVKRLSAAGIGAVIPGGAKAVNEGFSQKSSGLADRDYWVTTICKIVDPVLTNLSKGTLKKYMPVRSLGNDRHGYSHLEALGRSLAGFSPWLELGPANDDEGKLRARYRELSIRSIENAVNPESPDYLNFNRGGQPLVDAAFLAHGILRAPEALYNPLGTSDRNNLTQALKSTRAIRPGFSNWLLFSAMIEAYLLEFTGDYDRMRMDYAIRQHMQWYKGDGHYGDGPHFRFDYYNSYVIQPMLLDITAILARHGAEHGDLYNLILQRSRRHAEIQERLISPEGTFPVVGRSIPYRFGSMQVLAQIALLDELPESIHPAQVRAALTRVIKNSMSAEETFDNQGWLNIGLAGHQPNMAENYLSTGSMYLCTVGMLPLGLDAGHAFWTEEGRDWTSRKAWMGIDVGRDSALRD